MGNNYSAYIITALKTICFEAEHVEGGAEPQAICVNIGKDRTLGDYRTEPLRIARTLTEWRIQTIIGTDGRITIV